LSVVSGERDERQRELKNPENHVQYNLTNPRDLKRQIKYYETIAVSVVTYSSEMWTPTNNTETAEIKFLRNVSGYTLKD
jgi:hypothetical protein